jgi:hypothetical protein
MGYRTHLTLFVFKGTGNKKIGGTKIPYTKYVDYLRNHSIGPAFFNEMPDLIVEDEEVEPQSLYFKDAGISDDGEISIKDFLKVIKKCKENKRESVESLENAWLENDWTYLIELLENLIESKEVTEEDIIEFECY